jgi:hypothetical protein
MGIELKHDSAKPLFIGLCERACPFWCWFGVAVINNLSINQLSFPDQTHLSILLNRIDPGVIGKDLKLTIRSPLFVDKLCT